MISSLSVVTTCVSIGRVSGITLILLLTLRSPFLVTAVDKTISPQGPFNSCSDEELLIRLYHIISKYKPSTSAQPQMEILQFRNAGSGDNYLAAQQMSGCA